MKLQSCMVQGNRLNPFSVEVADHGTEVSEFWAEEVKTALRRKYGKRLVGELFKKLCAEGYNICE